MDFFYEKLSVQMLLTVFITITMTEFFCLQIQENFYMKFHTRFSHFKH